MSEYKRIDGSDFVPWLVNPSADRIQAYEEAGLRLHIEGDTLYVHCFDEDDARRIDREKEP